MGGKRRPVTSKRKPYKKPMVRKLTLEEAEAVIKAKSIPGDPQAAKLLNELKRIQSKK